MFWCWLPGMYIGLVQPPDAERLTANRSARHRHSPVEPDTSTGPWTVNLGLAWAIEMIHLGSSYKCPVNCPWRIVSCYDTGLRLPPWENQPNRYTWRLRFCQLPNFVCKVVQNLCFNSTCVQICAQIFLTGDPVTTSRALRRFVANKTCSADRAWNFKERPTSIFQFSCCDILYILITRFFHSCSWIENASS